MWGMEESFKMILGADGNEQPPRSCPVLSHMFFVPDATGIAAPGVKTINPTVVQAPCNPNCKWWVEEISECAVVVLAKKGLGNA